MSVSLNIPHEKIMSILSQKNPSGWSTRDVGIAPSKPPLYALSMRNSRLLYFSFILIFTFLSVTVGQASVKPGSACTKAGATSTKAGKKFTCIVSGKKLVWNNGIAISQTIPKPATTQTPTPKPSPALGSITVPIPMGSDFLVGKMQFRIQKIKFNVDEAVCKASGFNTGCKYDSNLDRMVDPLSTTTWVAIEFLIKNLSEEITGVSSFDTRFYLVLPNGQLLANDNYLGGYGGELTSLQLIPGGFGIGEILFAVPKSVSSLKSFLVLRDTSTFLNSKDYYFTVSW